MLFYVCNTDLYNQMGNSVKTTTTTTKQQQQKKLQLKALDKTVTQLKAYSSPYWTPCKIYILSLLVIYLCCGIELRNDHQDCGHQRKEEEEDHD